MWCVDVIKELWDHLDNNLWWFVVIKYLPVSNNKESSKKIVYDVLM